MDLFADLTWWEWFWIGSAFVYPVAIFALTVGLSRLPKTIPLSDADAFPVTVLVSARNEEVDLPRCIESLLALDYPKDKLQIVLVNDHSTDQTGRLIDEAAARYPQIVAVHSAALPESKLKAKARGIANGFKAATGDWVIVTDADAAVHPQWVRHTLGQLKKDTGMAGGPLVIQVKNAVSRIEKASWAFVQVFNLGAAGLGFPFICVGPNMAIKRSIYEQCGGLENSGSGVAEDLALLKMVVSTGHTIQTLLSEETTVTLTPVPSWGHLFSQQRRWFKGGIEFQPDYAFLLYLSFWWGFFAASFLAFGWIFFPVLFLILQLLKFPLDFTWGWIQANRMNQKKYLRYIWIIMLYQPFIFMFIPVSFLFSKKITWRGEGYVIPFD